MMHLRTILNREPLMKNIQLIPASIKDYPVIQNMARFYVYDMSEYLGHEKGWEMPENGLYECIDFKKYWEDPDAHPFLIRIDQEIAGFVIIDKKGSRPDIDFNMAQFFIVRKFKHQGIGRYVATYCFDRFKGTWEVMVLPGNTGAYEFWKKVVQDFSKGDFREYRAEVKGLMFQKKDIFCFKSH